MACLLRGNGNPARLWPVALRPPGDPRVTAALRSAAAGLPRPQPALRDAHAELPPPDQPYGSQPYGGPAQGYSYGYGAQEPQSGYPGQSYDGGYAPQTYPQQSYAPTYPGQGYPPVGSTHPENKPTLGIIGFAGVAVFTVVLVVTSALMGHAIGAFVQTNGIEVLENADSTNPLFVALAQSIQGVSYLATFSVFAGIAAWITSIVAFARRAGRKYAVGGILLGIAAPIIAILTIGFVLAPYIQP